MVSSTSTAMPEVLPSIQILVIDDEQYEYGDVKMNTMAADSCDR